MSESLSDRLRDYAEAHEDIYWRKTLGQAADEIEQLQTRAMRAEATLRAVVKWVREIKEVNEKAADAFESMATIAKAEGQ